MSSAPSAKWGDLAPRIGSAVVMMLIGVVAIWIGGIVFGALVALVVGLTGWEITRMIAPGRDLLAVALGGAMAAAVLLAGFIPGGMALLLLFFTGMMGAGALGPEPDRVRFLLYTLYTMIAGFALTAFHAQHGVILILWLVALVIATDVMGYFAGRILGGPKFWPAVSPKKTWSGTVAGWIGAAIVGAIFAPWLGAHVIWLSVILSFGSQMGDAAESALKRFTGIKDSSNLIPGHGGVFDRFDALLGATFCLYLAQILGLWG